MQVRLEKVIIFGADVEKLVDFYHNNFGLTVLGEVDKHWTELDAGHTHIAFHKTGDEFIANSPEQFQVDSNVKLVFQVDTDIELFRKKLLDRKVDIGELKQFPGYPYKVCDGRDPEGNVFQIIQPAN